MKKLWLNYKDEKGNLRRILVDNTPFVIGRNIDNDLNVNFRSLARRHAFIESVGEDHILEVTNIASINGNKITEPKVIEDGDLIILGNELEIKVEIVSK